MADSKGRRAIPWRRLAVIAGLGLSAAILLAGVQVTTSDGEWVPTSARDAVRARSCHGSMPKSLQDLGPSDHVEHVADGEIRTFRFSGSSDSCYTKKWMGIRLEGGCTTMTDRTGADFLVAGDKIVRRRCYPLFGASNETPAWANWDDETE